MGKRKNMSSSVKIWIAVAVVIISGTLVSVKAMAASVDMELVQAAWDGNSEKATLALNNGASPNAVVPVSGWTPLLCASWRGALQIVNSTFAVDEKGKKLNKSAK